MTAGVSNTLLPAPLVAALADGAWVVTPNERLGRHVRRAYDALQRSLGARAWPTPVVMTWSALLLAMHDELADTGRLADPLLVLNALQEREVWSSVLRDTEAEPGVQAAQAAVPLALEAWALYHGWGGEGDDPLAWPRLMLSEDALQFARWARAYRERCRERRWIDLARLSDALAPALAGSAAPPAFRRLVLSGFMETSPQQERLVAALDRHGVAVSRCRLDDTPPSGSPRVSSHANADDEIEAALRWARHAVETGGAGTVGIVVPDLDERAGSILRCCEAVLSPNALTRFDIPDVRPFSLSWGHPMASHPRVAAAVALLELATTGLEVERAALLLESAHVGGHHADGSARGAAARALLDGGGVRVGPDRVVAALAASRSSLAGRWRAWFTQVRAARRRASPAWWRGEWHRWLTLSGWTRGGEGESLASDELQIQRAWEEAVDAWSTIGVVSAALEGAAAAASLGRFLGDRLFQPAAAPAPIQVLGALEAAGLPFDALWVCTLDTRHWPRQPSPNPLLPIRWQRRAGAPRSSAARELAYSRALLDGFGRAAPRVRFSYGERAGDEVLLASPLLAGLPREDSSPGVSVRVGLAQRFRAAIGVENWLDRRPPALSLPARIPGGAGTPSAFARCPFQAFAAHRLAADPWPDPFVGLSPLERGNLLHAALAALGRACLAAGRGRLSLPGTDAGDVGAAVEQALATLPAARWEALPAVVRSVEGERLALLLDRFLTEDAGRPDYRLEGVEQEIPGEVDGAWFRLRIDRIDRLGDGSRAIIDYKSGRRVTAAAAFGTGERPPLDLQLALYHRIVARAEPDRPIGALVLSQVTAREVKAHGLVRDSRLWPIAAGGSADDAEAREAAWTTTIARIDEALLRAIDGFVAGDARVAPVNRSECRVCAREALCRVGELSPPSDDDRDDDTEGGDPTASGDR